MTEARAARPTLAKVARLANVSTATASNVLTGKGRVSPETVARVLHAARQVGYRTHTGARALSIGSTTSVGVLVPSSVDVLIRERQSFFWIRLLDAFVTRCSELEVTTTIVNEAQAQSMIDSGIDVLVLLGRHDADTIEALQVPFGLPVVSSQSFGDIDADVPTHDAAAIATAVVGEFARLNRSVIAWMPGPFADAVAGWEAALSAAADECGMNVIAVGHDDTFESLESALTTGETAAVDAVFGLFRNPRFLIEALRTSGRRVPDDVAVIVQSEGILEEVTTPTLSNLSLCGAHCGDLLAERAVSMGRREDVVIAGMPSELVRRESTSIDNEQRR
ncbi:MAG: LacI family DNA-binding transcriptional regulator [Actinomycetes bacterium]